MQGKEIAISFGIFLYIFVLIGRAGFSYFLLALVLTIALVILSRRISFQLKKISFWQELSSNERFILIDVLAIFIFTLISVLGIHQRVTYPELSEAFRLMGIRVTTRVLGLAIVIWVGKQIATRLQLKKTADKQLVTYGLLFPTELISILIFERTFLQWLLQAFWLDLTYGVTWELIFLVILLGLLLWGRWRLIEQEKRIAARIQL